MEARKVPDSQPSPDSRILWVRLSAYYALLFMVNGIVFPYLQVILREMGFSKAGIGAAIGAAQLVGVAAPALWGGIADLLHRRRLALILAIGAGGCLFCLLPFARTFWFAALLIAAYYACREAVIPLSDGITFAHLAGRRDAYGYVRAWGSVGFVLSTVGIAAAGGGRPDALPLLFAAYALFCAAQLVLAAFLPDPWAEQRRSQPVHAPGPARRQAWRLLVQPRTLAFVGAAFLARATMMGYYSFFSLYLREDFHVTGIGYLWALGPIAEIPVIFFSGFMIRKMGLRGLMAMGLAGVLVRLSLYASTHSLPVVVAAQALHCLTFGAVHVASVNFVDRVFPPSLKATGQGLFAAVVVGIGGLTGSAVAGRIAENASYRAMYGWLALAAGAGLVLAVAARVDHAGRPNENAASG